MAYKDSSELQANENYALGDYSFRIERSSVPGSTNDQITAICTQSGKNARKSIQIPSLAKDVKWFVEANDTVASVYVRAKVPDYYGTVSDGVNGNVYGTNNGHIFHDFSSGSGKLTINGEIGGSSWEVVYGSASPGAVGRYSNPDIPGGGSGTKALSQTYESEGKKVYYTKYYMSWTNSATTSISPKTNWAAGGPAASPGAVAFMMIYGRPYQEKNYLVGRFAINLEDAGGVGPGSDWIDPGDDDPDWEEGEPTHTLYVTVTGALSGRHNDPIEDPSYSYIPADKDTVKDYGCGGDGGHGGGGGAGASTVVIHKFATNQANSKEVTAIARRHGYGSGGGKGGKGGDGCILVYY